MKVPASHNFRCSWRRHLQGMRRILDRRSPANLLEKERTQREHQEAQIYSRRGVRAAPSSSINGAPSVRPEPLERLGRLSEGLHQEARREATM